MGRYQTLISALLIVLGSSIGLAQESYAELGQKPYEYNGRGREIAEDNDIDEIRIGLFVPTQGERAAAGLSLRRGAELAIIKANETGGIDGKPLALVIRPDDFVWGSAREVVDLVYEDRVWAVAGAVGGESTHIAEQIVTKARVPLLGIATTDASLTQINIPWMFRLMPDDDEIASTLAVHMKETEIGRIAVLTSTAYDNRLRSAAFEAKAQRLGIGITLSLSFEPGGDFSDQLERIVRSAPEAIVLWAGAEDGVRALRALGEFKRGAKVFAGPGLASDIVSEVEQAEGLTLVAGCHFWSGDSLIRGFREKYRQNYGCEPDVIAAYAYDGMEILIEAIRRAGLNRAKIRDQLALTKQTAGVTGVIDFDHTGSNTALPVLLKVREHRFCPISSN